MKALIVTVDLGLKNKEQMTVLGIAKAKNAEAISQYLQEVGVQN